MKLSFPSIHPFIRMPVSSFLPVPKSLVPQFPPPHRGAVTLTSLSGCGTLGESGVVATWGAGQGRQSQRVSASQPGWACAR